MPSAAGMGGWRSRKGGAAKARAQSGPKAAGAWRESCAGRSGAGSATHPGTRAGPRARVPHSALGPDTGREARVFSVSSSGGSPEAGLQPRRTLRARGGLRPGLHRPLLPRPGLLGEGALGSPPLAPQCRGHAHQVVTVLLFLPLTWPPRRQHGDGPSPCSRGFLAPHRHRWAVGSSPGGPDSPAPRCPRLRALRRLGGPRHLPRSRPNAGAWQAAPQPGQRPLRGRICGRLGAGPSARPPPAAQARSCALRDRPNPPPPRWLLTDPRGVDRQLRPRAAGSGNV